MCGREQLMAVKIRRKSITESKIQRGILLIVSLWILAASLLTSQSTRQTIVLSAILYVLFILSGIGFKSRFITSPIFLFVSFCFLYSNTFPFINTFGGITYYTTGDVAIKFTSNFALRFFCILLILYTIFFRKLIPNNQLSKVNLPPKNNNEIVALAIIIILIEIIAFYFGGFYRYIAANETVRTNLKNYVENYGLWTFLGYLNIYLYIYLLIYFKQVDFVRRTTLIIPIVIYFMICLLTGSRKYILFLLIITLNCTIVGIIKSKKYLLYVITGVIAATFMRVVVMDRGFSGNFYSKLAGMTGEFIFPYISFPLSVQRGITHEYFNYPTLLDSVLYFIPRSFFPQKNYSIGYTFSYMIMNVGMGFASSPLLEGYINFGEVGFLFEGILIIIILIFTTRLSKTDYMLYMFGTILLIDLNRGEVSFFVRQIFLIWVLLFLINKAVKKVKL